MNREIIDCRGSTSLAGQLLKSKYRLGDHIASGNQAIIFDIEGGYVAKIQPDLESEITTLQILKTKNS